MTGFSDLQLASFESSIDGNAGFGFKNPTQNWGVGLRFDRNQAFVIRDITNANDAFVVTTNGRVGIGTTDPEARLEVAGDIAIQSVGAKLVFPDATQIGSVNELLTTNSIVQTVNGGTGMSSAGAAGNYLRSDGTWWTTSPIQAGDVPDLSATYVDLASDQTVGGAKTLSGQVKIDSGINNSGAGFQHMRIGSGSLCTTAATAGQSCVTGIIAWPIGFTDTNYTVSCTGRLGTGRGVLAVNSTSTGGITLIITALTNAAANFNSVDCIGIHD
jgi:hypothetical protein